MSVIKLPPGISVINSGIGLDAYVPSVSNTSSIGSTDIIPMMAVPPFTSGYRSAPEKEATVEKYKVDPEYIKRAQVSESPETVELLIGQTKEFMRHAERLERDERGNLAMRKIILSPLIFIANIADLFAKLMGKPPFSRSEIAPEIEYPRQSAPTYRLNRSFPEVDYYTGFTPFGRVTDNLGALAKMQAGLITYLGIGVGSGLIEGELKRRFGDRMLIRAFNLYSLAEEGVAAGTVDKELPSGDAGERDLGRDEYHRIVSLYGTFYSGYEKTAIRPSKNYGVKQMQVLQKVIDALKVGGEAFLTWDLRYGYLGGLIFLFRKYASFFRARGVDIVIESIHDGSYSEAYVWVRKMADCPIDIQILANVASLINAGKLGSYRLPDGKLYKKEPVIRITKDGEWRILSDEGELVGIVKEEMIKFVSEHGKGVSSKDLFGRLKNKTFVNDEAALNFVVNEFIEIGYGEDILAGMPARDIVKHVMLVSVGSPLFVPPKVATDRMNALLDESMKVRINI